MFGFSYGLAIDRSKGTFPLFLSTPREYGSTDLKFNLMVSADREPTSASRIRRSNE
jgi:hypothetical protein